MINKEIINLRHHLHQYPEVSNQEYKTSEYISDFMNGFSPSEVISISKTGKAFVFDGKKPGKTIIFRAELDALPIVEKSLIDYTSLNKNVAHMCGHDGHMAILAGLAQRIAQSPPEFGKVVLLFQPAEEVEQGAKDVVEAPEFRSIKADCIFALHNIPGVEKHTIVLKNGSFAAASKGMTIKLFGKTSHAAEPENGISPANAISLIIRQLNELMQNKNLFNDVALLTFIHLKMGEISFGTSPGYAEIRITLRAFQNEDMELLTHRTEKIITEIANAEKLTQEISYSEEFPACDNDAECVSMVERSARENNFQIEYIKTPFKWSEDFGYYSQKYKTCLFGLGAGIQQPQLHNPDYDFPDEIIETGVNIFYSIYKNITNKNDE
ncbi:MAG: amidohydrolase [Bacteroidetes bacterium HGW-Bacteroidetes-21]|jgi:amidohydrolase|nr:MAG: amidohydrolase [Bacteroidetes bacterium HGW-Bacteroidetes-21]